MIHGAHAGAKSLLYVGTVFRGWVNAQTRIKKEIDAGVTPRSQEPIDFTNFGELGELIKSNWDVFGGVFKSPRAVESVMSRLNTLRGPIAHCCPLSEDEVVRLRLSVRDWFRLME
ncbi:Swt1 family HEPN domain-containing protein [Xanthomonas vesicatoria]|uniref:Swt1 family HEPN domain-containing protein n=1 Tax=Xanthomonas vesicatoria TaxID=56460 RepID=UPI001364AC6D|nr:Swt1 family HEPN domain-containing protein [Xanthomonas vesicatoria]